MEKLTRCEGDSTPETLLNAAQIRGHHRIILETEPQDLWARDILYHISCYKNFTSPRALQLIIEKKVAEEDAESSESGAEIRAFEKLVDYVEENIIKRPESVTNISDLCSKYVECLNDEGISLVSYRAYLLKARLVNRFGDVLTFHRPRKRNLSEYVFSSNVPPGPLINKCAMALAAMEHAAEDLGIDCSPCTSTSTRSQPHMHFSSEPSPTTDLFKAAFFFAFRNVMHGGHCASTTKVLRCD